MSAPSPAIWAQALGCLGHVALAAPHLVRPVRRRRGHHAGGDRRAGPHRRRSTPACCPLELGLADLPELPATPEGAARLRNGNPGMVIASTLDYGDEAWASYQGQAVAVGVYRAGELHPTRVFAA